jgi:hypothetical protein
MDARRDVIFHRQSTAAQRQRSAYTAHRFIARFGAKHTPRLSLLNSQLGGIAGLFTLHYFTSRQRHRFFFALTID